jgi:hypothetical protein
VLAFPSYSQEQSKAKQPTQSNNNGVSAISECQKNLKIPKLNFIQFQGEFQQVIYSKGTSCNYPHEDDKMCHSFMYQLFVQSPYVSTTVNVKRTGECKGEHSLGDHY